jgi:hypothetical protein
MPPRDYFRLTSCAGCARWGDVPLAPILFLHGKDEAAIGHDTWSRLLRHPLPAYFADEGELVAIPDAWEERELPTRELREKWRARYQLYAPQRQGPGPWSDAELTAIVEEVLPLHETWHLAGTSFGGAGVLRLLQMNHGARFLSLALATPVPVDVLPLNLPDTRTRYGGEDHGAIRAFCANNKALKAKVLPGRDHGGACRHGFEGYFEWLDGDADA